MNKIIIWAWGRGDAMTYLLFINEDSFEEPSDGRDNDLMYRHHVSYRQICVFLYGRFPLQVRCTLFTHSHVIINIVFDVLLTLKNINEQ